MTPKGWICLHRSIVDHWIYQEAEALKLWVTMLTDANHESKKHMVSGRLIEVKRGQLICGRISLSERTGISEKKIRRYLELLESEGMIGQQKTNKYSIISITNYDDYQDKGQQRASSKSEDDGKSDEKGPAKTPVESDKNQLDTGTDAGEGASKGPAKGQQRATPKQLNNENNFPTPEAQEDDRLARWMFGLVTEVTQDAKEPNFKTWAKTVRLMRERDRLSHRRIAEVFAWANKDQFWRPNILSPDSLRKQFTRLTAKMAQPQARGSPITRPVLETMTDRSWAD